MTTHRYAMRIVFPEEIQTVEEATGAAEAIASKLPVGFEITLLETWQGAGYVPIQPSGRP